MTLARHARLIEECGGDVFLTGEDYLYEDAVSRAGLIAAASQRLGIMAGVFNPYTRHPALLAMTAATLDRIGGGRLSLVVGHSWDAWMAGTLGYDVSQRWHRLRDYVMVVRRLLRGDEVDSDGPYFRLRHARLRVLPVQAEVPVWVAAMGSRGLGLATSAAAGLLLNTFTSPEYVRWAAGIATDSGRAPGTFEVGSLIRIVVTRRVRAAFQAVKPRIAMMLAVPRFGELYLQHSGFDTGVLEPIREMFGTRRLVDNRRDPLEAADGPGAVEAASYVTDEMAEAFTVIGPPESCRKKLVRYAEAGLTLAVLSPFTRDFEDVAKQVPKLRV